jgi:16S rRNA (uracil1498-N3)-methyltransferase
VSWLYLREGIDASDVGVGSELSIVGSEARHAVTVNRARIGDRLTIGDGRGLLAAGAVIRAAPDEMVIEVDEVHAIPEPSPMVTLVQALAKGGRDELAIQAATELGVDAVVPWSAERSISRWTGPKVSKGLDRWRAIVREATKQSVRGWLPTVATLATTHELAARCTGSHVLVLEPSASRRLSEWSADPDQPAKPILLVVGPEGGISPAELELLSTAGARTVRLGEPVLRTSTAGPAALAVLNGILGRW